MKTHNTCDPEWHEVRLRLFRWQRRSAKPTTRVIQSGMKCGYILKKSIQKNEGQRKEYKERYKELEKEKEK